ncbi:hypothetical protein, partial [Shinella sp. JR1-6]|uniref:hypothetical protein n=1 Tax=Shinella sp. JR1-6 TaxID=2527671 RepID=UPI001A9F1281
EAQQCVKLTGTNSSIGLIVLIVHAHRINSMSHLFCPDARSAPDGPRHTVFCFAKTGARRPLALRSYAPLPTEEKDVFTK